MTGLPPISELTTHNVENQPDREGARDLWRDDVMLREAAARGAAHSDALAGLGAALGTTQMREAGLAANRNLPELVSFDRGGRRLDEVRYHPAYHTLLGLGLGAGYAAVPWQAAAGGHCTHAAMVYMMSQIEPGVCCPMTMSYAAVPVLAREAGLANWKDKVLSQSYDPAVAHISAKSGVTVGMAMTEKQGGSDLRTNTTRAVPDGDHYRLTGHKWFCSAPMSDGFLTLAQAPCGLSCFLVPRWLEDER
ncbi:MAG: acyl-CoA dehydrogenase family protein, partial [Paracoccaceae bacterium]